ncbi:MAG: hypothetical protein AB1345_08515 [Chloroflexota bacterium]
MNTLASQHPAPEGAPSVPSPQEVKKQRQVIAGIVLGCLILIAIVVVSVIFLLQDAARTEKIRDIFIIFMALESLLIGLSLVVLMVQIARLINLLQNEVTPILESTQEAVNTLRGTGEFLSNTLVEPVIKLNEYLAVLQRLLTFIKIIKK